MIARSLFVAAAAVLTALSIGQAAGLRVNTTPSIPEGIYLTTSGAAKRGDVVMVCPPDTDFFRGARKNGYLAKGRCSGDFVPLMKPVAAVAGDTVEVGAEGLRVNGALLANSRAFKSDAKGNLLPHPSFGVRKVGEGEVWLVSSYDRRSIDSRYFGPLDAARIQTVVRPIMTRGGL